MDEETYLKERVNDQPRFYEDRANKTKRRYYFMQIAVIILGLTIPVAVNFPKVWGSGPNTTDLTIQFQVVVTLMSLTLASLNGLLNFMKYGDLWLSYRMTEEFLKHEKYLYLTSSGKYSEGKGAFPKFVETIETIVSSEHSKFQSFIEEARRPKAPQAGQSKATGNPLEVQS